MFEHLDDTMPLRPPTADEVAAVVGDGERLRRRTRRLRIAAVAIPTAAVVAALAVVVGTSPFSRQSPPDTATSGSPAPAPTGVPDDGSIAPDGPYDALMVRGQRLVAIDSTGRERPVRDLAQLGLTAADLTYAYISTSGILTLQPGGSPSSAGTGHEFVDLTQPSAPIVLAKGLFDGRTWSPDGRHLLTGASGRGPVVIDSATGRETEVDLHGAQLPGGGPSLIWTADGTGVLVQIPGPVDGSRTGSAIAPIDGGPLRYDVPALWRRLGQPPPTTATDRVSVDGESVASEESLGMSPDGATALVTTISNHDAPEPTFTSYLVPLDGNPPVRIDGTFAGWVPTAVVDEIVSAAG